MKYMSKLLSMAAAITLLATACNKVEDLPYYGEGKVVTLSVDNTTIAPTQADSTSNVVTFSWTSPDYATDTSNYKFIVEIDSTGRNFASKVTKTVLGEMGTSFTGRELNDILLNYGFELGTPYEMDVRVVSSYANNNERYVSNTITINVTPFNDPSTLSSTHTTVSPELVTASQKALTFSWTPSFPGYNGVVTYSIQYDSATHNFASPGELPVGASLYFLDVTEGEINETALSSGVIPETTGAIEYRLKATTEQGAISYSNTVTVTINSYLPVLRFYLPGGYQSSTGNGNDWDPGTAPELIRDMRPGFLNNMYYTYIWLPAGAEFKVTQGRSWDVNYGGSGGNLVAGGSNFSVPADGVYRITINRATMQYDIREGRMGFVGGATGAGWDPPSVFPNYAMGHPSKNLFVGLTNFTTDGWKMIDDAQWNDGSGSVAEARSYGSPGGSGSSMEINGANFPNITTAGRYRVIWDGRNVDDIKYEMSPAEEMRLVGDGIDEPGVNAWDPGTSPQMTYLGNGQWSITVNLFANKDIKFLAGAAWGAFDYEDDSGQSQALGTPRKIKWEGGDNFKTPAAAGSYTIVLDEKNQTVTIN